MSRQKSKTLATWLAVVAGSLGMHRIYLFGHRDMLGWLHTVPTLAGLVGVFRTQNLGQDDQLSWALLPLLGVMLSAGMLQAIVLGLTSDERWQEKFNPHWPLSETGWGPVLGVIVAVLVGGTILMSTVAYSGQRLFEWELGATLQNSARLTA